MVKTVTESNAEKSQNPHMAADEFHTQLIAKQMCTVVTEYAPLSLSHSSTSQLLYSFAKFATVTRTAQCNVMSFLTTFFRVCPEES